MRYLESVDEPINGTKVFYCSISAVDFVSYFDKLILLIIPQIKVVLIKIQLKLHHLPVRLLCEIPLLT